MPLEFNINKKKKNPINRNNLFYSEDCFEFEKEIGKEYIEQDMNQSVVLFQVDIERSNLDSIYNETKKDGIVYKTPIELPCVYNLEAPDLKSYEKNKSLGVYKQIGKLNVSFYQDTLDENECDINIGDYLGIQVNEDKIMYFSVVNDGRMNVNNEMLLFGTKPFYRTIIASYVDENEFRGL